MRSSYELFLCCFAVALSGCITTPVIEAVNAAEQDTDFPADAIARLVDARNADSAFKCSYTLNEAADATFAAGGPGGQFRFVDPEAQLVMMAEEFVYGARIYDELFDQVSTDEEKGKFKSKKFLNSTGLNHYADFRSIPAKEKAFLSDIKECMSPITKARLQFRESAVGGGS